VVQCAEDEEGRAGGGGGGELVFPSSYSSCLGKEGECAG
jgi:hypothetical protein